MSEVNYEAIITPKAEDSCEWMCKTLARGIIFDVGGIKFLRVGKREFRYEDGEHQIEDTQLPEKYYFIPYGSFDTIEFEIPFTTVYYR